MENESHANQLLTAIQNAFSDEIDAAVQRIHHCVEQLDNAQLWWRPYPEMNSIANLILHLAGNMQQWLVAGLSAKADNRDRQAEFDDRSMRSKEDLLQLLDKTARVAQQTIRAQTVDELLRSRKVQEFELDGCHTILDSVAHLRGHTQEVIHITRCLLGADYRFDFIPSTEPESPSSKPKS